MLEHAALSIASAILLGGLALGGTPGATLLPGSQPQKVEISWEGTLVAGEAKTLTVAAFDQSVITVIPHQGMPETVRIVTMQSAPEGWGSVLAEGRLPAHWQEESGYFESCYVDVRRTGDGHWEGSLRINPSASIQGIYHCMVGTCEETMIFGLSIQQIGSFLSQSTDSRASTPVAGEFVVSSTADTGQGTLRWALQSAGTGDVITFDPAFFPPDDPAMIFLRSELPPIGRPRRSITIDASNAGVIIDGRDVPGDWNNGLQIYTDGCVVMGLQIRNFTGSGITACDASRTRIGGDPSVGVGPTGQGNLVSGNGIGIDVGSGGSDNLITGNIIGMDALLADAWGNAIAGIWIEEGVTTTTIGPGNTIAYNCVDITIEGTRSLGNTLTRNNFQRSVPLRVVLRDGGNADVGPPFIEAVDSQQGIVTGTTCADCSVEVYAFDDSGWSVFEGSARADDSGHFTYVKGEPLAGQTAIALATDPRGNSGPLSSPAYALVGLQEANSSPVRWQRALPSSELADNRTGVFCNRLYHAYGEPGAFPDLVLDPGHILGLGAKRVRFAINSSEYQRVDWSKPELYVDPDHDAFITALADAGVSITLVMTFWDTESSSDGRTVPVPRFETEEEVNRYLEFVRFVVSQFKDRIEYYEMWNEPSLPDPSIQSIDVENYLRLVKRTVPVIREEFPDAKVVVGGTHSLIDEDSQRYLYRILQSDVMPLIDVVSWHPMYGSSPAHDWGRSYYYAYPSLARDIKSTAVANGFSGTFIADEIHWCTHSQPEPPWPSYGETTSTKYYLRGTMTNLGLDVSVTQILMVGGTTFLSAIGNLNTAMAGHQAIDVPVEINIDYEGPVAYCAFRYPNDDRMLAVWTDGVAQDEDHGVPATITFPSLAAGSVTGIDVLHGFEQELIFEVDGEDTIVRDLLIKDYPILIRISDVAFGATYEETVGDGFHRLGDPSAAPTGSGADRDGDGVPDDEDLCPDWPGSEATSGC